MLTEAEITTLLRTMLAALLGFVIGWERKAVGAPVRERTMAYCNPAEATDSKAECKNNRKPTIE
jgi:hypothetical protein